ncbi:MAG TPA: ATP-dependent DNA helicase RecG [Solirubrobacteraceae bacterium]|nr:ATP-dependent DNA helicase RecG [Solirubrobacteraceae bacterium]
MPPAAAAQKPPADGMTDAPADGMTDAPAGPIAFGSAEPLGRRELREAPVRWPRPSRLDEPLKAPSKRAAAGLSKLGLHTVGDLLAHLPSDSREARTVSGLRAGEPATVSVEVRAIRARPVRNRRMRPLVEATVFDTTGSMRATFFNQPWLVERYPAGTRLVLHGKPDARGGFGVSHHAPATQRLGAEPQEGEPGQTGSVAHYPAAEGVTSTEILALVQGARGALADVTDHLEPSTRTAEGLPDLPAALAAMHFPRDSRDPQGGRRRLAFDELLLTQLVFLRRRAERRARGGAIALSEPPTLSARWLETGLPFAPTGDQRRAMETIEGDLATERPMQRLLMGEVGSGKTVVALHAMLRAVEHDRQAALMAPTETLAEQHFATIQTLLGGEQVRLALLTGSTPAARRRDVLAKLASGELSLVVGTHALIEPDVRFASLAVAVIDEQHRFGVRQREALGGGDATGSSAHTLHMTATPIPRTQSLARYGDLDTSTLRELPRGRQPIATRLVVGEDQRAAAYEHLRAELRAGRQAYVVCPLIEESEEGDGELAATAGGAGTALKAATAELVRLREGELAGFELELLHGGMRPAEKQAAMSSFAGGAAQVLVATTVIEVGVDVPNATVMLVENGERFGLSQLHQLRGRVGRGEHAATCFVVGQGGRGLGSPRLRALVEHEDGFRLAEIDLELRSEGDLLGTRQSGLGQFAVAQLPEDAALLERARARAEAIVASDPLLERPEHELLAAELTRRFGEAVAAPIPG